MRAFFRLRRSSRSGRKRVDKIFGVIGAPFRELEARAIPLRPILRSAIPDAHTPDSPMSTVSRGAAHGAKAETARRRVAACWCQREVGAAATTTALDPAVDARQAISR